MKWVYDKIQGDKIIWVITIFLALISLPLIYVATDELALSFKGGNTSFFVIKHFFILLTSLVLIYYVHLINHSYFSKLSMYLMYIAVPLLLFTMISGVEANAATRWMRIPIVGLSFQTSDFAKLALTLYLARALSKKQAILGDFKQVMLHVFAPVLMVCALTVKEDFSTTALIFGTCIIIMFFGNVKISHIGIVLGGIVLVFVLVVLVKPDLFPRMDTWMSRLNSFSDVADDQEGNYQSNLSKAAILDGGMFGTMLNGGKYPAPPQAASDFMFSTLIKNFGMVGGFVTLLMYLLFLFRSIKVAVKAPKLFSSLLVIGLAFSISFQAFSNMAVAVGLFPVTGQALPMISMGGTSIWFTALSIGIILSVSRDVVKKSEKEKLEKNT
ncbi:MAG: cell division protein FtsW [Glaciecola sp.]|jgi:cell division protein FtsW